MEWVIEILVFGGFLAIWAGVSTEERKREVEREKHKKELSKIDKIDVDIDAIMDAAWDRWVKKLNDKKNEKEN